MTITTHNALVEKRIALRADLQQLDQEIHQLRVRIAWENFGIKQGSIVTGRDGKEYLVTAIKTDAFFWKPDELPELKVRRRRNDGEWANIQSTLYTGYKVTGFEGAPE